jgi:aryl-alcohol dehydrogenase-like predicted oxidoreductase
MALAYVASRPFVTSVIIGATSLDQLASNLKSLDLRLSPLVLSAIEEIHRGNPNPCP